MRTTPICCQSDIVKSNVVYQQSRPNNSFSLAPWRGGRGRWGVPGDNFNEVNFSATGQRANKLCGIYSHIDDPLMTAKRLAKSIATTETNTSATTLTQTQIHTYIVWICGLYVQQAAIKQTSNCKLTIDCFHWDNTNNNWQDKCENYDYAYAVWCVWSLTHDQLIMSRSVTAAKTACGYVRGGFQERFELR